MRAKLGYRSGYWHYVVRLSPDGDGWTTCGTSFTVRGENKVRTFWPFWGTVLCPKCWNKINPHNLIWGGNK